MADGGVVTGRNDCQARVDGSERSSDRAEHYRVDDTPGPDGVTAGSPNGRTGSSRGSSRRGGGRRSLACRARRRLRVLPDGLVQHVRRLWRRSAAIETRRRTDRAPWSISAATAYRPDPAFKVVTTASCRAYLAPWRRGRSRRLAGDRAHRPSRLAIQSLSIIPGATDRRGIMPFWEAVLGYDRRPDSPDEDLIDPHERLAPLWFEEMDELRADGAGSIHLVVWVPWDVAATRVRRASRQVAGSSATTRRRASGPSPIRPATRWTSRRHRRQVRSSEGVAGRATTLVGRPDARRRSTPRALAAGTIHQQARGTAGLLLRAHAEPATGGHRTMRATGTGTRP